MKKNWNTLYPNVIKVFTHFKVYKGFFQIYTNWVDK